MEPADRLKQALALRDQLAAELHRIEARRDLALKNLSDVDAEIRSKGIDPDKIDETIQELEAAYEAALSKFQAELEIVDQALAPYRNI
jgi:hypothetical protein